LETGEKKSNHADHADHLTHLNITFEHFCDSFRVRPLRSIQVGTLDPSFGFSAIRRIPGTTDHYISIQSTLMDTKHPYTLRTYARTYAPKCSTLNPIRLTLGL
jgi:hypothetical protein